MNLAEYAAATPWVRAILMDPTKGKRKAAEAINSFGGQQVGATAVEKWRRKNNYVSAAQPNQHTPRPTPVTEQWEPPRRFVHTGPHYWRTAVEAPSETLATHIMIPDTQAKAGVPTDHLDWIGQYIADQFAGKDNVKLIHIGDHADMPSLSSYDQGKKAMEGRRYKRDIEAANEAFSVLNSYLDGLGLEKHITLGNHEDRINRAVESDAQLEGIISLDDLNYADWGWEVHRYLDPVFLDGIGYAHFWANPMSGKPYGGMALTKLKTLGHSFTMGHQQKLDYAIMDTRDNKGRPSRIHGLTAGACYLHNEDYKGPQGNDHWRGIIVKHMVRDGEYDLELVSLYRLREMYG